MRRRPAWPRLLEDAAVKALGSAAALLGILALGWILWEVARRGAGALGPSFFTSLPAPPGAGGGGVANAIVGTLAMTGIGALGGIPAGLLAGVYLAEYGRRTRLGALVHFSANVMMGVPSIITGLFVYSVLVRPLGRFSGAAGGVALALIIFPVVARTTEDMLRMVPASLRESALALGAPRWHAVTKVLFRAARAGIATGCILAIARVSGETAPLLFTALNSPYWTLSMGGPTANLTVTIFNYAMSPYPDWQRTAWGASLLITAAVLALTVATRAVLREAKR